MFRRSWIAGSFAIIAGIGCHAGPSKNLAKTEVPISRTDVSAARFIANHNQNAAAIKSLEASPSIALVDEKGERDGRANGHLALDGKRNFRLEVEAFHKSLADIGSNDEEFWFWVKDDKEKILYYCDHNNINALAFTLQPDWIMEAMGLRGFTADEASKVHTKQGEAPGTLVLTQFRKDNRNQVYTKETIVSEKDNEIREHKLYAGAKKELLASAVVTDYIYIKMENPSSTPSNANSADPAIPPSQTVIRLPSKVRLTWVKEKLAIDIAMSSAKINPTFPARRRVALFKEPTIPGTTRRDLALVDPVAAADSARVYESRPIPPHSGISFGNLQPIPMDAEGTSRRAIDPAPLSADLSSTPAQPAGIVGALVPSSADYSSNLPTSAGRSRPAILER